MAGGTRYKNGKITVTSASKAKNELWGNEKLTDVLKGRTNRKRGKTYDTYFGTVKVSNSPYGPIFTIERNGNKYEFETTDKGLAILDTNRNVFIDSYDPQKEWQTFENIFRSIRRHESEAEEYERWRRTRS